MTAKATAEIIVVHFILRSFLNIRRVYYDFILNACVCAALSSIPAPSAHTYNAGVERIRVGVGS